MSFPRYPAYKPSGVEWLGEVPEHWETVPLKHLADFINGDAFKPAEWADSGMPIIRIQNLNGGEDFNYYDGVVEDRYLVHDGDLLFGWSGNRGTSFGPFRWSRNEVCALNQHIFRVVPRAIGKQALYWILKAVTAHVEDQAHGIIGMVHITKGDLGAINVPVPEPFEQYNIATFLDRETAKIDALIAEQQRLIELLQEKRQAVISHAVTKGLHPDAPMKDSGVEWLGEVPEHWEVGALSYALGAVGDVDHYMPETVQEGVPYVMTGDLKDLASQIDFEGCKQVADQDYKRLSRKIKTAMGDLIMARYATIGTVAYVDVDREFLVSYSCVTIKPDAAKADGMYLFFCLKSDSFFKGIQQRVNTNTQENIGIGDLKKVKVALPPVNEQLEIVKHLQAQVSEMDGLIKGSKVTVGLLKERRSALISAAVTGQIDVRALVPEAVAA